MGKRLLNGIRGLLGRRVQTEETPAVNGWRSDLRPEQAASENGAREGLLADGNGMQVPEIVIRDGARGMLRETADTKPERNSERDGLIEREEEAMDEAEPEVDVADTGDEGSDAVDVMTNGAHDGRMDELLTSVKRFEPMANALPEMNRNNARMLEVLSEYAAKASQQEASLRTTLERLTQSNAQVAEVVRLLRGHLETTMQTAEHLQQCHESFRRSVGALADSAKKSEHSIAEVADSVANRGAQVFGVAQRIERRMMAALIISGVVSAAAIIIAVITLLRTARG
ncbi:MAG TPA: hypothetical protein VG711_08115 [Phycisphaerales bacterium]|nr:hypothetical protein [Phycisphaerales bacterium]